MALALYDRVQETGTAVTTVSFTLSGAVTGFQSFSVIGNGNTTYYSATDSSGNWEVGIGTYVSIGPSLTRTTIYSSSNAGAAVTFSGTVTVFVTYPADNSVVSTNNPGTSGYVLTSGGSGVAPTWVAASGGGASVTVSSTAPSSPSAGDLWWDDVGGRLKIYYTDANTSQWIDSTVNSSTTGAVYDTQTFTSSGTWTKPVGVNNVRVVAIGGGAGGSSGRKGAVSSNRAGGAGGAGGMRQETIYAATFLPSTVSVTIGSGGAGGVSVTTNSTNGNIGTAGGNSTFGSYLIGSGGFNGLGVSPTITITDYITGQLSQSTSGTTWLNAANSSASYGGLATSGGPYASFKAGNGGGGGSISSANALSAVGYGSAGSSLLFPSAGGSASATDGSTGSNGTATTASAPYGGGGGGGGQASLLTNAGAGGAGALYGGGGGGGGASTDSLGNSGAGGNGADGIIVVISW